MTPVTGCRIWLINSDDQEKDVKRTNGLIIGTVLVVLLLAGAAVVGGRLVGDRRLNGDEPEAVKIGDGLVARTGSTIQVLNAPGMPATPPDAAGVFVRRQDRTLFLGTGVVTFQIDGDATFDGPMVEVVSTHDTRIHRDDTAAELGGVPPAGPVQQILRPGTLDEIGRNDVVSAWGEKHGDRLVATVIVYVVQ
jgi:hypothetical protein